MMANDSVRKGHLRNMQHAIGGCLLFFAIIVCSSSANAADTKFVIDSKGSSLVWTGHKVTGSHTGHVMIKSADPVITNGKLTGGTFSIDMTSLVDDDLKDESYNAKLTNHLKSDDFFHVEKFPLSELKLTKVEPISGAKPGESNYTITGDLTILGITNSISFPALVRIANNSAFASASIKVDRTRWNLRYGSGKFFQGLGDKLIYDEFTVDVKLLGKLE